jgi:hypothetical protein
VAFEGFVDVVDGGNEADGSDRQDQGNDLPKMG